MSIFRAQSVQARPQFCERKAVNAGIHFADGTLLRGSALFFNDGLHAAFGIAQNAAIVGRVIQLRGENRGSSFTATVRVDTRCGRVRIPRPAPCMAWPVPRWGSCRTVCAPKAVTTAPTSAA